MKNTNELLRDHVKVQSESTVQAKEDVCFISIADLARELGCTVQTINRYRRKAESKSGNTLGQKSEKDSRVTVFSENDANLIRSLAPAVSTFSSSAEQERQDDAEAVETQVMNSAMVPFAISGLVRQNTRRVNVLVFEQDDVDGFQQDCKEQVQRSGIDLLEMLSNRADQSASRIVNQLVNTEEALAAATMNKMADRVGELLGQATPGNS